MTLQRAADRECDTTGCQNPAEAVTAMGYICADCAEFHGMEV